MFFHYMVDMCLKDYLHENNILDETLVALLVNLCWELTPGVIAQQKGQVSFKIFYAKRIYFSFEFQTINTNLKLTRISNIPL